MRVFSTRSGSIRLAAALLGSATMAAGLGFATPAVAQKAPKNGGFSPAFQAAAAPLEAKINAASAVEKQARAGDAAAKAQFDAAVAGAPALLAQVEGTAKTPQDKLVAGQMALNLGIMTNNLPMAERGARAMLASKLLDPTQTAQVQKTLAQIAQIAAGPQVDPVAQAVEAQVKANNPRGALAELRRAVAARPAGQPAPAAWLARATQLAVVNKIPDEALFWSARQVELYPTNINWLAATQTVRQFVPMDPQLALDLFRLMARSGALNNETRFVSNEYATYADMANLRGAYGEAVRVIDQGVAAGALNAGGSIGQIRRSAAAKSAGDKASLPGLERDSRAAANGIPALATADLYLGGNEPAKAEELYKLALQKGAVDKDRAYTRLGMAQFDQGKYAEARDSFTKVGGVRSTLARLWLTLVDQRSRGGAA
ncbi:MAG: hypothetical protein ABW194_02595 [Novosphingobium sp.]